MSNTKIPGIANFYRGDTKKYKVLIRDKVTGDPISIDGGTLFVTFKKLKADTDAEAAISLLFLGAEADPENPTGEIIATLSATDTTVDPGKYFYDFQFVSSAGEVTTILPLETHEERVRIFDDVTKRVVS